MKDKFLQKSLEPYDSLLELAKAMGLKVVERAPIKADGRIQSNYVFLSEKLETTPEKLCTLTEEVGHALNNTGDINDQTIVFNRQQELKARKFCYEFLTPLMKIVDAILYFGDEATKYNVAEYLNVTEKFLNEAINHHRRKNGNIKVDLGMVFVVFYPEFKVYEKHKI